MLVNIIKPVLEQMLLEEIINFWLNVIALCIFYLVIKPKVIQFFNRILKLE